VAPMSHQGLQLVRVTTAVAAKGCRCTTVAVGTTVMVASRAFVRWDCLTIEREVTSCSPPDHGERDKRSMQWIECSPSLRNLNTQNKMPHS
jgi:hypothetical protein